MEVAKPRKAKTIKYFIIGVIKVTLGLSSNLAKRKIVEKPKPKENDTLLLVFFLDRSY